MIHQMIGFVLVRFSSRVLQWILNGTKERIEKLIARKLTHTHTNTRAVRIILPRINIYHKTKIQNDKAITRRNDK